MAPNTAQVFCHVFFERILVRQNLVADAAGRATQVNLVMGVAAWSMFVRFIAQAAHEKPILFKYMSFDCPRRLRFDRLVPRIACKIQVARQFTLCTIHFHNNNTAKYFKAQ